jgi:excisionase family DNA binding protein
MAKGAEPTPDHANRPEAFEPISVRISEACRLTGIGRSKLYELIASGDLEVVKVGAITLVPFGNLRALVDRRRSTFDRLNRSQEG